MFDPIYDKPLATPIPPEPLEEFSPYCSDPIVSRPQLQVERSTLKMPSWLPSAIPVQKAPKKFKSPFKADQKTKTPELELSLDNLLKYIEKIKESCKPSKKIGSTSNNSKTLTKNCSSRRVCPASTEKCLNQFEEKKNSKTFKENSKLKSSKSKFSKGKTSKSKDEKNIVLTSKEPDEIYYEEDILILEVSQEEMDSVLCDEMCIDRDRFCLICTQKNRYNPPQTPPK